MLLFVLFFIVGIVLGTIGLRLLHRWDSHGINRSGNWYKRHHS